jgi:hypothetical protein
VSRKAAARRVEIPQYDVSRRAPLPTDAIPEPPSAVWTATWGCERRAASTGVQPARSSARRVQTTAGPLPDTFDNTSRRLRCSESAVGCIEVEPFGSERRRERSIQHQVFGSTRDQRAIFWEVARLWPPSRVRVPSPDRTRSRRIVMTSIRRGRSRKAVISSRIN